MFSEVKCPLDAVEPSRVELQQYERSPRLAEIRAVYKSRTKAGTRTKIDGPVEVAEYLRAIWNANTIELSEDFVVLCLNTAHRVIGWVKVSSGGYSSSQVDPRVIFAIALQTASAALVLAHNHPSGELSPSDEDKRVTDRLVEAGKLLNVKVLDHIILSREASFSFKEHGLM